MNSRILGRAWGILFALGAIPLLLACAPAPPSPAGQEAAKPAAPRSGGILHFPTVGRPENLHSWAAKARETSITVDHVFQRLVAFDVKQDWRVSFPVVPELAERWEQPDPKTYILHLRQGVKWHDGAPFTADDVVWALSYAKEPKNAFTAGSYLQAMDTVEKVDNSTVKVTTKAPTKFLVKLAQPQMTIMPRHIYDQGGDDALKKAGVGTGPFKIKSFEPSARTVFVKNPDYWQRDRPYLDGMIFIHNMDPAARTAAFTAKEIDIITVDTKQELGPLKAAVPDLQAQIFNSHHLYGLLLNMAKPPYNDIRVRRAGHLALDRKEQNDTVSFGVGVIDYFGVPAIKKGWGIPEEEWMKLPGYRQPKDQDIAEAKRLLVEAGYPNGFKTTVNCISTWVWTPALCELLPSQLKKVGIEMKVNFIDSATYFKVLRAGDFDTAMYLLSNPDLEVRQNQFFHSKGPDNNMGLNDPKLDALIERMRATTDDAELNRIVRELQDQFAQNVYYWPTVDAGSYYVLQSWVHDYVHNYSQQPDMTTAAIQMWLDVDKLPRGRTLG